MQRGITLFQGILLSLLIHAALAAPVILLPRFSWKTEPQQEVLNLDFLGIKGKEQVAEKILGEELPQNEKIAQVKPPEPARPRQPVPPRQTPRETPRPPQQETPRAPAPPDFSSPVVVETPPPPTPDVPQETAVMTAASQRPPEANTQSANIDIAPAQAARTQGADTERQQQSLEDEKKKNEEATRRYLAQLHRAISPYVKFPSEARNLTASVMPKVRFSVDESGHIVDDHVEIVTSSGHPAIDQAAIRATRHGAPFPKPPRAMTIAMRVEFSIR
jgi:protein TonB